jgi:DNA polymerase III delta prime subunit
VVESGAVVAKLTIRSKPGGLIVNLADIYVTTATLPPHILIHGQEGVGKTTLAAAFPKSIFLQTEDGCPSGLEIATFGLLTTYQGVLAVLGALATEPHHYRTFVLDSLDPLEAIIWSDVCKANGWASIESPGYGKGYVAADTWWLDLLAGLDYLRRERGMMIVLLAHSAIETVNDPRAASYTSYQLRLHKRARGRVQDWADAIGFLAPDLHVQTEDAGFGKKRSRADGGAQRWIHWEGRPSFLAKNRYGLPSKMPVPKEFEYGALVPFFPPLPADSLGSKPKQPTKGTVK